MPLTTTGTATFTRTIPGADTFTQTLFFGVQLEPDAEVETLDESLCTLTVTGDEIEVEFPTYEIPDDKSVVTTIRVVNFYEGINQGLENEASATITNAVAGEVYEI